MARLANKLQTKKTGSSQKLAPEMAPAAALTINDKAAKRVIAPFVRIVRKGQKSSEVETNPQFNYYLNKKPSVLIRDLSSFLSDSVDLASLLHETTDVLKLITKAAGVTLYMMDPASSEIYQSRKDPLQDRHKIRWKIEEGTIVAAYVAYKKEWVMLDDILKDSRFPEGIGYSSETIKSVLSVPVVTPGGACFAVIELFKLIFDQPFTMDDLSISLVVPCWMGVAIQENSQRLALQRQQELNDYLLDLTKCYFGNTVIMDKIISELVKFARLTLGAERGMFFFIDKNSDELVADLYEVEPEDVTKTKRIQKVRLRKDRGIAGLVARTGVTINIKDAYQDCRYNKEFDKKTGFIARSILCMPIKGAESEETSGVIQLVNKKSGGYFTSYDEILLRTFTSYSALALRYTEVTNKLKSMNHLNNVFEKIFSLQIHPCEHDSQYYKKNPTVLAPTGFEISDWYIEAKDHDKMPPLCVYMVNQLLPSTKMISKKLMNFALTVRKFYRHQSYHNFEHGFNTMHCMYIILKRNFRVFPRTEIKALMTVALCHDVVHPGFTNSFLELSKDDLSYVFKDKLVQRLNFQVIQYILEKTHLFHQMPESEYNTLIDEIKTVILSVDYSSYLLYKQKLCNLLQTESLDLNNKEHRLYVKSTLMFACYTSGTIKPFLVSKRLTKDYFDELYCQGDLEKKMGCCPLPHLDREKMHQIPEIQIDFLKNFIIPCFDLLQQVFHNIGDFYEDACCCLTTWQEVTDIRGKKCWRQGDSIVENRFVC